MRVERLQFHMAAALHEPDAGTDTLRSRRESNDSFLEKLAAKYAKPLKAKATAKAKPKGQSKSKSQLSAAAAAVAPAADASPTTKESNRPASCGRIFIGRIRCPYIGRGCCLLSLPRCP